MSYVAAELSDGRLKPKHSAVAGDALGDGGLDVGEIAVNSADGHLLVGKSGSVGFVPGSATIKAIATLTQAQYDAITATASTATLYIITPNP